jgi:hypothetical protein
MFVINLLAAFFILADLLQDEGKIWTGPLEALITVSKISKSVTVRSRRLAPFPSPFCSCHNARLRQLQAPVASISLGWF